MEWEPEAKAAIDRAPFFVRRIARRKVEEQVQADGRRLVTLGDVRRAKEAVGPNPLSPTRDERSTDSTHGSIGLGSGLHPNPLPEGAGHRPHHAPFADGVQDDPFVPPSSAGKGARGLGPSSLTEEQIRLIERLVDEIPGQESRYWSAKSCGGAVGCPLTLMDARAAWQAVIGAVGRSGLSETQAARITGPVLSHHQFKAAVAGCPNCCSEPQIKDFALVARARPTLGPGECIKCGSCEAECKEGAVSIGSGAPVFDLDRCVGCGACADVCDSEVIAKVVGYDVLVGGRLGRRPRLALAAAEGVTLEQAIGILERCLARLVSEGLPGERLGALLDRVGWQAIGSDAAPGGRV